MTKYCCVSDLHLGCHSDNEAWHTIILDWGKWLKTELESKDIEDMIICGDFFDNRNEIGVKTIAVAGELMDIWSDINIIMITGNHDLFYKNRTDVTSVSIFAGRSNISIISDMETRKINNKTISFMPWGANIAECPKSDMIFGHLAIDGFSMMPGKVSSGGLTPKSLTSKSPLTFSGHFHLRDERKYKNSKIIYVGSPYQLNWGEVTNNPGYYVIDMDSTEYEFFENTISPKHRKIDTGKLKKKDIEGQIISVEIDPSLDDDEIDKLKSSIYSKNPLEVKFNILRKADGDETTITYDGTVNILSVMNEFIDDLDIGDLANQVKDVLKDMYVKYEK